MKRTAHAFWIALGLMFGVAFCSFAIVIRHDRDDAQYIALGAKYPAVGHLGESVECTLIAPRWAIGAAHTVENYFNPYSQPFVVFTGKRYTIEKIILHPARIRNATDSSADIALIKLTKAVEDVTPVLLYDKNDEVGKIITMVGRGKTGTGLSGPVGEKGKVPRGATNRVAAVFENSLIMTFDAPPHGTELEGICGPGDSGCPALLERDGKLYTLGISSCNIGEDEHQPICSYRTIEAFARISTRRQWILETIAADPPSTVPMWSPLKTVDNENAFPTTPAGRAATAFLTAFNTGRIPTMATFYTDYAKPNPDRTPEQRAEQWRELIEQYGRYEVRGYVESGPYDLAAIVYSTRAKTQRGVWVKVESSPPHKLASIQMGDLPPR